MTLCRLLAIVSLLGIATSARAETRRVAIVVGQNVGAPSEIPLHYAESDASKVADVLTEIGEVDPAALFLLRGARRDTLRSAFDRASAAIAALRARPEDRTLLVFYYSGHSDGEYLELAGDRVRYDELRSWLGATHADVRVVIIDGCKSGAMVQKGGKRAPAFEIKLSDTLDATGEALLTSSAADEVALESKEIHGSFFTHHLVSGLRGAADTSGDGRVTLSEAYEYAFSHTLTATMQTGMGQHPAYEYKISGQGELVLTEIGRPTAKLELPEGFDRALVVLVKRDQVLAELTSDTVRTVAVRGGEYAVRVWKGGRTFAARVQLSDGQHRVVAWSELANVTPPAVATKGPFSSNDGLDDLTPEARAEYDTKFFQIGNLMEIEVAGSGPVGHVTTPKSFLVYRGKYRTKMDEGEFFRTVGRKDLAESYDELRFNRYALVVGGAAVIVGGLVYMFTHVGCDRDVTDPQFSSECVHNTGPIVAGLVGSAAGGALIAVGLAAVKTHPVESDELRRLADEYNEQLRRRLSKPAGSVTARSLRILPYANAQGGGLGVVGRF